LYRLDNRLGKIARSIGFDLRSPNLVDVNQGQHGTLDPVVGCPIRANAQ